MAVESKRKISFGLVKKIMKKLTAIERNIKTFFLQYNNAPFLLKNFCEKTTLFGLECEKGGLIFNCSYIVLFPLESASLILHILGSFRCVFTVVFALFYLCYPPSTAKALSKVLSQKSWIVQKVAWNKASKPLISLI